jgi:hypothetical protein
VSIIRVERRSPPPGCFERAALAGRNAKLSAVLIAGGCTAFDASISRIVITMLIAFRPGEADRWLLFMIALGIIALLAILQPLTAAVLARLVRRRENGRSARSVPSA